MEFRQCSPHLLKVWRLRLLSAAFFGIIICSVICAFFLTAGAVITAVFAAVIIFWYIYLAPYYRSFKYTYINGFVIIEKGFLLQRRIVLPNARLLFLRSYTTPLCMLFGLRGLIFYGGGVKVKIAGLTSEQLDCLLSDMQNEEEK